MFAWMNRDTLEMTLATGHVTYWSRSRQSVWRKGETSGHHQRLVEAYVDCDGDVLLLKVDQMGPACHTGAPSCFFRQLDVNVDFVGTRTPSWPGPGPGHPSRERQRAQTAPGVADARLMSGRPVDGQTGWRVSRTISRR